MIDKLQRRFILICAISVLSVVTLIFGVILVWNISSLNKNMDFLADRVSEGGGKFPETYKDDRPPDNKPPKKKHHFDFFTPETPFSTRYFTVFFDDSGEVDETYYIESRYPSFGYRTDRLEVVASCGGSVAAAEHGKHICEKNAIERLAKL